MAASNEGGGVIGVDGGQSTIRLRHSDGGAGSAPGVSWGRADTSAATADAIVTAWEAAGAPSAHRAVLGLTTVPEDASGCDDLARRVAARIGVTEVVVCDDGITTFVGALGSSRGIVIAVGTGVACASRPDADAPIRLTGGHGYLLGDEGGAFWIGSAGVRAALRSAEGRGAPTALTSHAAAEFGALDGLAIRLHSDLRAVDRLAGFAPRVASAALDGDAESARIIDAAVGEVTDLAMAAWRALGERPHTPLVFVGRPAQLLEASLQARLADAGDAFELRHPLGDAVDGALAIAADRSRTAPLHVWTEH